MLLMTPNRQDLRALTLSEKQNHRIIRGLLPNQEEMQNIDIFYFKEKLEA